MNEEEELRRARLAKAELNLVGEFLDKRRQELYEHFIRAMPSEDLHVIHTEATALTRLEEYLQSLVNGGKLIQADKEFNQ